MKEDTTMPQVHDRSLVMNSLSNFIKAVAKMVFYSTPSQISTVLLSVASNNRSCKHTLSYKPSQLRLLVSHVIKDMKWWQCCCRWLGNLDPVERTITHREPGDT